VVISGSVAAAQAVPVTKYTLRSSLLMRNDGDPSIDSSRWTATIVQAADKRGRMDIVDGFDREFKKGDYVLFDSAGAIVVRPATKQFYQYGALESEPPPEIESLAGTMPTPTRKHSFKVDSLGAGETIDGRPTHVWKITYTTSTSMDPKSLPAGMEFPTMTSTMVTQLWIANAPAMPHTPFGPFEGTPDVRAQLFKMLSAEARAALRRFPKGKLILRSRQASSMSSGGPIPGWKSESSVDVVGAAQTTVASSLFVLPADYVEIASPMPEGIPQHKPTADHGAKWRAKPGP
jgi:hypothetical protein